MQPMAIFLTGTPSASARARFGSYADAIRRSVGPAWTGPWSLVECTADAGNSVRAVDLGRLSGIVVTGSASSVLERAPWMDATAEVLRQAVAMSLPVLGICFGHQLLAYALGGQVGPNPRGREIGTVPIQVVAEDPVLGALCSMRVQATHVDSVLELPMGSSVLAGSSLEPHAALRFAREAWGVQFHPEFSPEMLRLLVHQRRDLLVREGFEPARLIEAVAPTPRSTAVLARFARRAELAADGRQHARKSSHEWTRDPSPGKARA
jgi:GMP synthase (glutamine-hydrolysing)